MSIKADKKYVEAKVKITAEVELIGREGFYHDLISLGEFRVEPDEVTVYIPEDIYNAVKQLRENSREKPDLTISIKTKIGEK